MQKQTLEHMKGQKCCVSKGIFEVTQQNSTEIIENRPNEFEVRKEN